MNKLLLGILFIIAFSNNIFSQKLLPKKIYETAFDKKQLVNSIVYNKDSTVSKINYFVGDKIAFSETFDYKDGLLVGIKYSNKKVKDYKILEYENTKLMKDVLFFSQNEKIVTTYNYLSDTIIDVSVLTESINSKTDNSTLSILNNNVEKVSSETGSSRTITYDTHPNILAPLLGQSQVYNEIFGDSTYSQLSKNYMTKSDFTNSLFSWVSSYVYDFGNLGEVKTITVTDITPDDQRNIKVYDFEY